MVLLESAFSDDDICYFGRYDMMDSIPLFWSWSLDLDEKAYFLCRSIPLDVLISPMLFYGYVSYEGDSDLLC